VGEDMFEKECDAGGIDGLVTITLFVSPWSTMTKTELKLEETRRSMIILQEICWNR